MDRAAFEAACRRDGFADLEQKEGPAGLASKPHTHPFAVRGLVLAGEFTLTRDGAPRTYRAGESFRMDGGCEHAESFGPDGARYLIARRHDQAGS